MTSFEPLDCVRHILDEVAYLRGAGGNVDESTFLSDAILQRAFIRSLEVIGEVAKRLPLEFRAAHPEIGWRGMTGMRDRLHRGYFGVDLAIASTMSPMRPLTSSGSTDTILSNAVSHPRAERVGRHKVYVASEDARKEVADVQEGERAERVFELDERVDVAGGR